jgi:hypothetical protein
MASCKKAFNFVAGMALIAYTSMWMWRAPDIKGAKDALERDGLIVNSISDRSNGTLCPSRTPMRTWFGAYTQQGRQVQGSVCQDPVLDAGRGPQICVSTGQLIPLIQCHRPSEGSW